MFGESVPSQLCTQITFGKEISNAEQIQKLDHSPSKTTVQCFNKHAPSRHVLQLSPWTYHGVPEEVNCGGAQIHEVQPRHHQAVQVGSLLDAAPTGVCQQVMQVDGKQNSSRSVFLVRGINHAFEAPPLTCAKTVRELLSVRSI